MAYTQKTVKKVSGVHYFAQGWQLITRPGIKRFVILPLLVNILLMGGAFWWLFNRIGDWVPQLMSYVPDWLQWLSYLLWPVMVISVLLVFSYLFSTLANFIAAPFSGLLAEQLEASLTGKPLPDTGIMGIVKDLPRIMAREWRKLAYYLPRALVLLLLYFIPGIGQTVAPVLWFLFSAWMLSIQYCDYPFDNHKVSFQEMRSALRQDKVDNLQFGALVSLFTMIPFLNLVIMPVAVCGATAMWVDRYRDQFIQPSR
ncbi:sulfate transporter CysZ [Yersinia mollaretii]|uniref:Sulfate transporter CysZ n=1 Tax=Yersinia mollaretii (strain ATCC 43969 / DSM 18520 / CIP 103324 / CNY 7263 / WAIP 204) TaxID=349967 RepID=A0ABP2E8J3_YERMW|nr:sulfate transporter CysZ [Yersinia mollaretii]EEQ08787.1 Protein cysZ [Yersinia mollaretii ATCC 43969]PJE87308.1 sulfate transporter CysZ [Yersinia mollaretii]QKJ04927.1 sulfate transporter CysZ [Yersinia mollaretii ATCC 43969]CQD41460.1 putative sulfate transport protein CysZ [Yersinia mollaretii]CQH19151.1 putative sulfate transport protein CysZ [Yersinia mollaretii]